MPDQSSAASSVFDEGDFVLERCEGRVLVIVDRRILSADVLPTQCSHAL